METKPTIEPSSFSGKLVMAIAFIICAFVLAKSWERSHYSNANKKTIAVTGSAHRNFISDLIVWEGQYSKKSMDIKEAYRMLKNDNNLIKIYLVNKGVKPNEMKFSAININRLYNYQYNDKGALVGSTFNGYDLSQTVTIESKAVDKIELISREITELINDGVEFNSNNPNYFYTQLSGLKHEILKEATEDARVRAETIAQNAGSDLKKLVKTNMGVFQIVAQNSSEEFSSGGTYNTSSKNKTITVTVNLEYSLE